MDSFKCNEIVVSEQINIEKSHRIFTLFLLSVFVFCLHSSALCCSVAVNVRESLDLLTLITKMDTRVWPQFTEQLWGTAWGELRWMNYTTTGQKWSNLRLFNGKTFSLFWFWQIGFYSLFEELKTNKHNFWTNRTHGGFTDNVFPSFIAFYDLHLGN